MNAIKSFSPDFRAALGRQARQHVKPQFDLDSVVVRWDGLYLHLLEERKKASRWALIKQSRLVPGTITFHPQHDPPHCEPRVDSL